MSLNHGGESFFIFMQRQLCRQDWVGILAGQLQVDRRFQAESSPADLRKWMDEAGAERDYLEALDNAEDEWRGRQV
jgi:hypothetical protein